MRDGKMPDVTMYTDGSCHGNPGPGGYAAIILQEGMTREVHGSAWHTTNNRMELTAVVEGLKLLSQPSRVTIVTDSKYVANQINRRNLKSFANEPGRKNADLWQHILRLSKKHDLYAEWVRGHSGNKLNQRCDSLANMEATRLEQERDIRLFVVAELVKDMRATPDAIARKLPGYPVETVRKYYEQFFKQRGGY